MIAIIKYNAGNIKSVQNALFRLNSECIVTDNPTEIQQADKVIFPGVGEASTAMKYLIDKGLDEIIKDLQQPVLGICLGLQLMCRHSEEADTSCLGIFDTVVKKFPETDIVPHIGWNAVRGNNQGIFKDIPADENFYFVHSFYAEKCNSTNAICDYILPFSAGLQKDNFYATQFHPEKSADAGEIILKNFISL